MFHAERPIEAAHQLVSLPSSPRSDSPVEVALSLRHLGKRFAEQAGSSGRDKSPASPEVTINAPRPALSDVSLEVDRGLIFGVVGRSGAGKSTLLRIAALLEKPDTGEVLYRDSPVQGLSGEALRRARRHVGVVFQSFNLFSARTALGNVAFPLEAAGGSWNQGRSGEIGDVRDADDAGDAGDAGDIRRPRADSRAIRERAMELLELVGLPDKALRPVSRLSGGERQRVAIARALSLEPEILFCDEATSALDPETTRSVLDLIVELRDRLGLTVVMVTHQLEVVRRVCDRVAVLDSGRLVEETSARELFHSPMSPEARRLVSGGAAIDA